MHVSVERVAMIRRIQISTQPARYQATDGRAPRVGDHHRWRTACAGGQPRDVVRVPAVIAAMLRATHRYGSKTSFRHGFQRR